MRSDETSAHVADFRAKPKAASKQAAAAKAAPLPDIGGTDAMLTRREAAALLGVCSRTLQNLEADGTGPALVKITDKKIGYLKSDLATWIASRRRTKSTPAVAA